MNAYKTDFNIQYDKTSSGSWFSSDKLTFCASSLSGLPLFKVVSDGSKNASVQTFSNSDPVNAVLAAFAISIKMEPKEFHGVCAGYCKSNISLDSPPNHYGGFGLHDEAFEAKYPTGPTVVQPPMGYAYGVQVAALPMAVPVLPTAVPFTAVPGVATFAPLPMAQPLVTPQIGVTPGFDPLPHAVPVAEPWAAQPSGQQYGSQQAIAYAQPVQSL